MSLRLGFLIVLVLPISTLPAQSSDLDGSKEADEALLKSVHVSMEGADLIDFLKKRSLKTLDPEVIKPLAEKLTGKNKEDRDKAMGEIIKYGPLAKPLLEQKITTISDKNVLAQTKECVKRLEDVELMGAVIRSTVRAKPENCIQTLIAYLPFTGVESLTDEVESSLYELGTGPKGADPALMKALNEEHSLRRGLAVKLISKVGSREQVAKLKDLLKDPKPSVRFSVAKGLADRYEPASIQAMIELLEILPSEQREKCESKLVEIAGRWKIELPEGDDAISRKLRKRLWSAWWEALDPEMLTKEIQKWTPTDEEREKILGHLKQLSSPNPAEKEKAVTQLRDFGLKAISVLRVVAAKEDPQSKAAAKLLENLADEIPPPLPSAIMRILAFKAHKNTVPVLLQYLPYAMEDSREVIEDVVPWIAAREDSSWPILVRAIEDPIQSRRLLAVRALANVPEKQKIARELLTDKDPNVRFASSFALVNQLEKEAIPPMIGLLSAGTQDQGQQVLDYLRQLKGTDQPKVELGTTKAQREAAEKAWRAWWEANSEKVTLVRAGYRRGLLGYTLIVENYNQQLRSGRVLELDRQGKIRWEIKGIQYPTYAKVLRRNRVLICEQSLNRVTERDFEGKILWNYNCSSPRFAARLPNGKTLIAYQNQLVEVEKSGKVSARRQLPDHVYTYGARLMKNGDFVYISTGYLYRRVDKNGKVLQTITVPRSPLGGSRYPMIAPNGNLLVTYYTERKIKEYDNKGKVIQEYPNVNQPGNATKTSRGTILVSVPNQQKVIEVDSKGKQVRVVGTNVYPWKAFER